MSRQADKPASDLKLIRLSEAARRADGLSVDTLTRRAVRAGIVHELGNHRLIPAAAVDALARDDKAALERWRVPSAADLAAWPTPPLEMGN